jgi:hypothetical protein
MTMATLQIPAARIPRDPPGYLDALQQVANTHGVNLIRRHDHFSEQRGFTLRRVENGSVYLKKVQTLPENVIPAAIAGTEVYEWQTPNQFATPCPEQEKICPVREVLDNLFSVYGAGEESVFDVFLMDTRGFMEKPLGKHQMISTPFDGPIPENAFVSTIHPVQCNGVCTMCCSCCSGHCVQGYCSGH